MFKVGLEYSKKYGSEKIRVLTQTYNRGKGGAIRMVNEKSEIRLFFIPLKLVSNLNNKHQIGSNEITWKNDFICRC